MLWENIVLFFSQIQIQIFYWLTKRVFTLCLITQSISHKIWTGFCFVLLCISMYYYVVVDLQFLGIHMIHLPISFRVTSLPLGQSYDCPSASEVTLKDLSKIDRYQTPAKRKKAWNMYIVNPFMKMPLISRFILNHQIISLYAIAPANSSNAWRPRQRGLFFEIRSELVLSTD